MLTSHRAQNQVFWAIRKGKLPKLDGSIACVDCGLPAWEYDHRDYDKPLDVEPVCLSCNKRRGRAANKREIPRRPNLTYQTVKEDIGHPDKRWRWNTNWVNR